ncbi:MAG: class I SAM-dependent RNA methyltransferase [Tissierellia bacterium]|nr:class I SAM-dependent RNA methyltransferase [Tissierellia bacterium]
MKDKIYDLIATTVFGLEAIVKRECEQLGFSDINVSNGRVEFKGTQQDIAKANLWLRSSERVLIKLGEFEAKSFDELYEKTKSIDWENYLSTNGKFLVSGKSIKSKLYSVPDAQSIVKKAIVDKMSKVHDILWFNETEERYKIEVGLLKDIATITLDTSGAGLHKRGYRQEQTMAPMKETLASALVMLSNWRPDRPLVDLFCGSGTILIEACLIGKNIAPGISREFDFMKWPMFDMSVFREEKTNAYGMINDKKLDITGFDIDREAIKIAKSNAINAGVDEDIIFVTKDVKDVGLKNNFGVIVSNPPYGERIGDEDSLKQIYQALKILFKKISTWSVFMITSDKDFEKHVGKSADRKRKLFNGRIEVDYYQIIGPNPDLLK